MQHTKTALIVGASRGLGLGLVQRLSEQGWQVTATVRDPHNAKGPQTIPEVLVETLDINDINSVQAFTEKLKGQTFDLLFINAGISGTRPQSAAHATADELGHLFMTNATSPIRLAEKMIGQVRTDTGILAFMSSVLGSVACPEGNDMALYKASKAALNSLTNTFVTELPEPRPTVLSMHPGWVKTDMGGKDAPLDVLNSTKGLVEQIDAFSGKGGHHFINYKGETIPW
ncbi:MAG: short chain dehydrogenase [Pseudomonas sp.]|nr:short chain dehydrogenase [Pseudomonas sp.]